MIVLIYLLVGLLLLPFACYKIRMLAFPDIEWNADDTYFLLALTMVGLVSWPITIVMGLFIMGGN